MMSLSDEKQADNIDAFNTTSRYLDDILKIGNVYFDNMVSQMYPKDSNLIKLIPLIPKPRFLTCICQFLMILFLPKFMINVTILTLKLSIPIFRFGLQEHLAHWNPNNLSTPLSAKSYQQRNNNESAATEPLP